MHKLNQLSFLSIAVILFIGFFIKFNLAMAMKLEYLGSTTIPNKQKFQKSIIGGLSGLFCNSSENKFWAISDDRGEFSEPRFYEFSFEWKNSQLSLNPKKVVFLKSTLSSKIKHKIFDLEGIAPLPWGNFLLSNEGDNNHRPRVLPQILDVKGDGAIVREFSLPDHFLPELSGRQKKGIQSNAGFEGVTMTPDGQSWWFTTETPLLQEIKTNLVRVIRYKMPEAWVLSADQEFAYPLGKPEEKLNYQQGISEILAIDSEKLLILERSVVLGGNLGLQFNVKLFATKNLKEAQNILQFKTLQGVLIKPVEKELIFDFEQLRNREKGMPGFSMIQNFEGMCWGPELSDQRKTILVVSDDNFRSELKTEFILFAFSP